MSTLFSVTREHRMTVNGVELFARTGGHGPPLLLLHGFPQTHAMWHRVAPSLMESFTCVMPDLRGYGYSSCPENDVQNRTYSKHVMAADVSGLMMRLGHERFAIAGHDRGGRVAYRLALDSPEKVTHLAVLDIVPTHAMWHGLSKDLAMKVYHWLFLAQPHPLPEMLIEPAPVAFLDYTLASWTKTRDLSPFDPQALAEYRLHYATPEHVHATCNDYRAGATIDLADDEADVAAGRKIACPTLALWGNKGIPSQNDGTVETADPLAIWQSWCSDVVGAGIDAGHFLPEENPDATLAHLLPFLEGRRS